jgi:hypothetical protein
MGDVPSARALALYDLRRARAGTASTAVLIAGVVAMFLFGRWELVVFAAMAFVAYFAVPSWVGVAPVFPMPSLGGALIQYVAGFGLPMVGVLLIYLVLTKGSSDLLSMAPGLAAGAITYSIYQWRYARDAQRRIRGEAAGMSLPSRLWRHYLAYAVGIGAGVGATLPLDPASMTLAISVFAAAFLTAKAAVDFSLPQPALAAERVSAALLQLTLMSPIWFGLPWGGVYIVMEAIALDGAGFPLPVVARLPMLIEACVACVVVFAATTVVAGAMELVSGRRE